MALTFAQMVAEAKAHVPGISPAEAQRRIRERPDTLVIDVQDKADIQACGLIPGAVPISLGMLPIRADQELPRELRDPRLQDRSRPVIVTCGAGGQAALGAYILKQMGFQDVAYIDGGMKAWKEAGLPVEPLRD
jgi:rhodanese-related sulfurtransferase